MNYVFLAIGIGIVAGLRSLLAPAIVAWAAHLGSLNLHGSPPAFMGSTATVAIFSVLAIGELVADKLPKTPKRTALAPLLARILTGGLCGASLCAVAGQSFTHWRTFGWNRRRDRSLRRLRNPAAYREQSAYQRYLRGHLRRLGCDRASLFPCLALTQSRHLVASLVLPLFISCRKMTLESLGLLRVPFAEHLACRQNEHVRSGSHPLPGPSPRHCSR
jgi:uncharacterized protein DUF4126